MGGLVLLALVLVTLSFREDQDGPVSGAQAAAASALRPFQVAADRVAAPFRDVYGWAQGLVDARSDAERLQRENETLRQQYARARLAPEPGGSAGLGALAAGLVDTAGARNVVCVVSGGNVDPALAAALLAA